MQVLKILGAACSDRAWIMVLSAAEQMIGCFLSQLFFVYDVSIIETEVLVDSKGTELRAVCSSLNVHFCTNKP